jgi:hypothetical protein
MKPRTPKPLSIVARVAALLFIFTAGVALAVSGDAWARKPHSQALATIAPTATIDHCAIYNTDNTIYTVTTFSATAADLQSNGDCVTLSADHSVVFFSSNMGNAGAIVGPGAAATSTVGNKPSVGLHITGDHNLIEGNDAFISGFGTGALDDGDSTVGDDVDFGVCTMAISAVCPPGGTSANGTGLEITNHDRWTNVGAFSNTGSGFWLNGDNHSYLGVALSESNGADGILVTSVDSPAVDTFISDSNVGAGVHFGCPMSVGGNAPARCSANNTAKVADGFAVGNDIGVLLDVSESSAQDMVSLVGSGGNTTFDMQDATTNCGSGAGNINFWFKNRGFTKVAVGGGGNPGNPGCIQ